MTREIKNARIQSTMLGYEDHGILTCFLYLEYGGSGQGFGGYALDAYVKEAKERIAGAYGLRFITSVLKVVGVTQWEDLPGKHIRADSDHTKVYRIGNLLRDEWFDPATLKETP